jgi:hypothetical protein
MGVAAVAVDEAGDDRGSRHDICRRADVLAGKSRVDGSVVKRGHTWYIISFNDANSI